jgi:hypothetical protein
VENDAYPSMRGYWTRDTGAWRDGGLLLGRGEEDISGMKSENTLCRQRENRRKREVSYILAHDASGFRIAASAKGGHGTLQTGS